MTIEIATIAGHTYTITRGEPTPAADMEPYHADRVDERTEADDDAWRWACMLRNQAADDALLYNTQDRPDSWGVGY
jgi:hypothetical protein